MKLLLFIALSSVALALPDPDEAARLLGSELATERDQLTTELWKSGRASLPLLKELVSSDDPEVSSRANFIFRRLRMGLAPDSPAELLQLAEDTETAAPDVREARLETLLEHPLGVPVALAFLDLWSEDPQPSLEVFGRHARIVTAALLEQRDYWKNFLSESLSPACRGALIAALSQESLPMKQTMIELLSIKETKQVFQEVKKYAEVLPSDSLVSIARSALVHHDVTEALGILFAALPNCEDSKIVRMICSLEHFSTAPQLAYEGPWQNELAVLRLRANGQFDESVEAASRLAPNSILAYETSLLRGNLATPSADLPVDQLAATLANALQQSFDDPPHDPDIENLAATVTNDWGRLSRTLLILGHPVEAAQVLSDRHQDDLAARTLWMFGHREEAIAIAQGVMQDGEVKARIAMRLTLTQLYGRSKQPDLARECFAPLFDQEIEYDHLRRDALKTGLLLYPRKEIVRLAPELTKENAFRRSMAISALLPFPPQVSVYCYEQQAALNPNLSPAELLVKVEEHLAKDSATLLKEHRVALQALNKKLIHSTDPLFHLALFLKAPGALAMVERSSWNRLATDDLQTIITDDSWDLVARKNALVTALEISPADPILRWHDLQLNQRGDTKTILQLTLGDSFELLQLSRLSSQPVPVLAAALADFKSGTSIQCLQEAAAGMISQGQNEQAITFIQSALLGELVLGTQPGTHFGRLIEMMKSYGAAREELAQSPEVQQHWRQRIEALKSVN